MRWFFPGGADCCWSSIFERRAVVSTPGSRRWAGMVLALVAGLVLPARAAAESARPFRVQFSSSAGCGDVAEFSEELLRRTQGIRPATPKESALTFGIVLSGGPPRIAGKLTLPTSHGRPLVRTVFGVDCHEVLAAMVLIAWVFVDSPSLDGQPRGKRVGSQQQALPSRRAWLGSIGQRATVHSAVMPGFNLGVEGFAELAAAFTPGFTPSLRLGFHAARSRPLENTLGRAAFTWWTARLSACPLRWPAQGPVEFRPCASLDAGRLNATGFEIRQPRRVSIFWSAGGLSGAFRAQLGSRLALGAEAGILLPMARDHYKFRPSQSVYDIPALGFHGGVGLSSLFF